MKIIKFGGAFLLFLFILYFLGPRPDAPILDPSIEALKVHISQLDAYVEKHESEAEGLKSRNEAKIVWADSAGVKTPYSIVYLHGFSASEQEGDPIHRQFAKRYGCNLYLARLHNHGLEIGKSMHGLTPDNYLSSAKKAISIGNIIGDSVIVMATSTGATLALFLANSIRNLKGLILYSPNIRVKDPTAFMLNDPWGKQIASMVLGGETYTWEGDDSTQAYWTTSYPVDALIAMQDLLEKTMTKETFEEISTPVFMGYYYKNDTAQDNVVSVKHALDMFEQLGTDDNLKRKMAFPKAGHHVIGSRHKSGDYQTVLKESGKFTEDVLGLTPYE
jgi:pimeloyl-ACP methyl ester carboxylesterase